mgnify:CR=1 FL=1
MAARLIYEGWTDLMVLQVCRTMRAGDVQEVFAQRPDEDRWALYRDLASLGAAHLWFEVARAETSCNPTAMFGVVQTGPGTGQAHLIGTPALTLDASRQIAARIRDQVIPAMLDAGLHRVEALSLADYAWAHRFLRSTGAQCEGIRREIGKNGEDFASFVWLKSEIKGD